MVLEDNDSGTFPKEDRFLMYKYNTSSCNYIKE